MIRNRYAFFKKSYGSLLKLSKMFPFRMSYGIGWRCVLHYPVTEINMWIIRSYQCYRSYQGSLGNHFTRIRISVITRARFWHLWRYFTYTPCNTNRHSCSSGKWYHDGRGWISVYSWYDDLGFDQSIGALSRNWYIVIATSHSIYWRHNHSSSSQACY